MAVLNGSVYSETLGMKTGVSFVIPYEQRERKYNEINVIYLLHGRSDDYMCWLYQSNISRYAADNNVMIVMPEVQMGWYTDMKYGHKYFTYVSEELPKIVENLFGIAYKRENTFIAGLSMGGYGALKCAFKKPGYYKGVAAFSAACDVAELNDSNTYPDMRFCFGDSVPEDEDVFHLAENLKGLCCCNRPKIYLSCGEDDSLLPSNRRLDARLNELEVKHTYEEWCGNHDWDFWNTAIQKAMNFFGL